MEPQKIYFDESGFTGNDLLHKNQDIFSYSSVATSDDEARDFVNYIIKKYNVQGGELKGRRLVQFNKGRKAISEIMEHFSGRIKIVISNKKYALAGKFFEYIFEPCIAENSYLFYNLNFHRFIANILYVEFAARGSGAEQIFEEFQNIMRKEVDISNISSLFSASVHPENSEIIVKIRDFAQSRIDDIRKELESLPGDGAGKWVLDLTNTSLFSLLADWGLAYKQITAICDGGSPLQHQHEMYTVMIGREEKKFINLAGKENPLTFNLSGPIQLADSKDVHGVQLADVIAAVGVYAVSGKDNHAAQWRGLLPEIAIDGCLFPDIRYVDPVRLDVQRNSLILHELHSRAARGISLLDGMPEYVKLVSERLLSYPLLPK